MPKLRYLRAYIEWNYKQSWILITRRSLVQIQPPQPNKKHQAKNSRLGVKQSFFFVWCFSYSPYLRALSDFLLKILMRIFITNQLKFMIFYRHFIGSWGAYFLSKKRKIQPPYSYPRVWISNCVNTYIRHNSSTTTFVIISTRM